MASVTISLGDVSVGYEDEDRGAKYLNRLAVATITTLVQSYTKPDEEESDG